MSETTVGGPIRKFKRGPELRLQPRALFHYCRRQRRCEARRFRLRQVYERALVSLQVFEVTGNTQSRRCCKSVTDLGNEQQLAALATFYDQRIEDVGPWQISA